MKAIIDEESCIGCELCTTLCPEVFVMNDQGKAEAVSGEVPSDSADCCRQATDECPVAAISIT